MYKVTEADDRLSAHIGKQIQGCQSLDEVAEALRMNNWDYGGMFVYRGGNHVAMHVEQTTKRIALITA